MASDTGGHARRALAFLFVAYAFSYADRQILSILFQPIKEELLLSDTQLGFLGGIAFALTYALMGIPLAMVADRRSRKKVITISIAIFSFMTAACGLASNFVQMALARVGVGLGEAGVNPATNSIIADYFPPEKRSFAMSLIAIGAPAGILMGSVLGGVISDHMGWRAAFFVLGIPGLLLAVLVWGFVREPERGHADGLATSVSEETPTLIETAQHIWCTPGMRNLYLGSTLGSLVGYGVTSWVPSFLVRTHDLTMTEVGLLMAAGAGFLGISGTLAGGYLYDRFARESHLKAIRAIAIMQALAVPFAITFYLSESLVLGLIAFAYPAFAAGMFLGPDRALSQSLARLRMRSVAAAISMLVINLVGLGIGAQSVGVLSDLLAPRFGDASLGYAMAGVSLILLWSSLHFYLCGGTVDRDIERARVADQNLDQEKTGTTVPLAEGTV